MNLIRPNNDFDPVHRILMQGLTAEAIMCAVELKVFDVLEQGEKNVNETAAQLGVAPERLEPMMDLAVAHGILVRNGERYANSPTASEFLVSTSPLYQGDGMKLTMRFSRVVENNMMDLLFDRQSERDNTDAEWAVEEAMEGTAQDASGGTVQAVTDFITGLQGFEGFKSMCDIGGNHGTFTMAVLDANPAMSGMLCDLPPVAEAAKKRCERMGYGERIATCGLDMRTDELPDGKFDLALTSHLLYGFKNDLGAFISKVGRALKPGGWFVSQHYAPGVGDDCPAARASLELMTRLAGYPSHHISREELEAALSAQGFGEFEAVPVSENGWGLIVGARKTS